MSQGSILLSLHRIKCKGSINLCTLIKSFVSWYNPFHEGELSRTRALLSTPTEPENTRKCTELVHVNLPAVSVNTAPVLQVVNLKPAWISTRTATISKTHM